MNATERKMILLPPNVAALAKLASKNNVGKFSGTSGVRIEATRANNQRAQVLGVLVPMVVKNGTAAA
jgi:hypothetical protein